MLPDPAAMPKKAKKKSVSKKKKASTALQPLPHDLKGYDNDRLRKRKHSEIRRECKERGINISENESKKSCITRLLGWKKEHFPNGGGPAKEAPQTPAECSVQ